MAKLIVCAVRDNAVEAFSRPLFVPALGVAIRSFQDECNRKSEDNPMYRHARDFALYELGTFDENDGRFVSLDIPKCLFRGDEVVVPQGD